MSPVLIGILETIVPLLVREAEKLFPTSGSGTEKHAWVQGMINNLFTSLADRFKLPGWINPIVGETEVLVKELIIKELDLIDP